MNCTFSPRFVDIIKWLFFWFSFPFYKNIPYSASSAAGLARKWNSQTWARLNTNQIKFILVKEMRYVSWSNAVFWLLYRSTLSRKLHGHVVSTLLETASKMLSVHWVILFYCFFFLGMVNIQTFLPHPQRKTISALCVLITTRPII